MERREAVLLNGPDADRTAPAYSPLRYPGGKTWFVPFLRAWLKRLPRRPALFVEPFAGGGSASLAVAAEGLAERILMVEKDPEVAALWGNLLGPDAEGLIRRVEEFEATPETVATVLSGTPMDPVDIAFRLLVRNRVARGRYLQGPVRRLRCDRTGAIFWHPEPLVAKLRFIAQLAGRIDFVEGDALNLLEGHGAREDCVLFLDPPYSVGAEASHRHYYRCVELDHGALFGLVQRGRAPFLMVYDDMPLIRRLAAAHGFELEPLRQSPGSRTGELAITRPSAL
jgi:DNA adenine methylase